MKNVKKKVWERCLVGDCRLRTLTAPTCGMMHRVVQFPLCARQRRPAGPELRASWSKRCRSRPGYPPGLCHAGLREGIRGCQIHVEEVLSRERGRKPPSTRCRAKNRKTEGPKGKVRVSTGVYGTLSVRLTSRRDNKDRQGLTIPQRGPGVAGGILQRPY